MTKGRETIDALRAWGLTLPGAHIKAPWPDHADLAVNDKTFAYLSTGDEFRMSVKLRYTSEVALELPFATPTAYGLGKSGWVSFAPGDDAIPDIAQLKDWIEESYRAQAPKKLVKELDARS
ncbi:MmcQ/YjbR family DNA-binding protein [Sphingomonas sp. MS122]|uniref:MmcQ/YjbR family DNA-binding protein n=1 Tax=Sphingomonas sp. MS122 TaxID=3412683 RepID=UPI003C2BFA11